ncbi:hypothetical protein BJ508DRAFT_350121 [Ascobolus immersus RN42]|uniref:Uncharacterized protein n=1 Tax=Ascobolus immersus RN42 TaxID=1160509 RepID=A0A3N4I0Q7_ASCIM|nr:hypothetical protein BJ508DRAFT_350121 [Ascobolus immersus RN42]
MFAPTLFYLSGTLIRILGRVREKGLESETRHDTLGSNSPPYENREIASGSRTEGASGTYTLSVPSSYNAFAAEDTRKNTRLPRSKYKRTETSDGPSYEPLGFTGLSNNSLFSKKSRETERTVGNTSSPDTSAVRSGQVSIKDPSRPEAITNLPILHW